MGAVSAGEDEGICWDFGARFLASLRKFSMGSFRSMRPLSRRARPGVLSIARRRSSLTLSAAFLCGVAPREAFADSGLAYRTTARRSKVHGRRQFCQRIFRGVGWPGVADLVRGSVCLCCYLEPQAAGSPSGKKAHGRASVFFWSLYPCPRFRTSCFPLNSREPTT